MYQYKGLDDTIAAVSTPVGVGGLGIIRLSGKRALAITDKMFRIPSGEKLSKRETHTVHYGWIIQRNGKKEETIDEALATIMRAPRSYTKEDVVEISCHGGPVVIKSILALAIKMGARLAEPGEFTKRAFLNGRIDLAQAEAVLDIIQSKTESFLKVSNTQLKGELSQALEDIREELMKAYVELEALVNFPEDDTDAKSLKRIERIISEAKEKIDRLLETSEHGRILKEGIKIVICGKPNVGKSSLLNILLKQPRAIVSDIAGTTRDTIEETASIKGIPFQLVDTAGILEPRDLIEEEAIKRSHLYIEGADLVLLMLDNSSELSQEDERLIENVKDQHALLIVNKTDLPKKCDPALAQKKLGQTQRIDISLLKKKGIEKLEEKIVESIWHAKEIDTHGLFISNLRHIKALEQAQVTLRKAVKLIHGGESPEFVSEEIKVAVNYLDNITGRNIDADLLDQIFSQFCIGK